MPNQLTDKVAVVTGGSTGIGRATVEKFVEEGAAVVVGDINDALGMRVQEINPKRILYVHADVSDDGAVAALVQAAVKRFGRLDVMFNNAGANGDLSPLLDLTASGFDSSFILLARSVLSGHRYAARQFLAQGTPGSIISTSSAAGLQGGWSGVAYTAAKHAIIGIVRQAAVELGKFHIRSNAICPGFTMTERVAYAFGSPEGRAPEFLDLIRARLAPAQPLGRVGMPSDIAGAAVFLASDASSFISGIALPVDGGATAAYQCDFMKMAREAAAEFVAGAV